MPNTITISRIRQHYEAVYGRPSILRYNHILRLWQSTSRPAPSGKGSRPRGRHVPMDVLNNRLALVINLMHQSDPE